MNEQINRITCTPEMLILIFSIGRRLFLSNVELICGTFYVLEKYCG